jgi:Ca2+-binding RTX toxin-like protein
MRSGNDLMLPYTMVNSTDNGTVTIENQFNAAPVGFVTLDGDNELLQVAVSTTGTIGDDLIASTSGADTLTSDDGDDFMFGGADNDTLDGGTSDDVLSSGGGDSLTGGDGGNIFDFAAATDGEASTDGVLPTGITGDFVTDFVSGTDKFHINGDAFGFIDNGTLTLNTNFSYRTISMVPSISGQATTQYWERLPGIPLRPPTSTSLILARPSDDRRSPPAALIPVI